MPTTKSESGILAWLRRRNATAAYLAEAVYILAKGIALSVATLFFETGASNIVSGFAQGVFILEEAFAASLDALINGGRSFWQAVKSSFKSVENTDQHKIVNQAVSEASEQQQTHIMLDRIRSVNKYVSETGNYILTGYYSQKESFLGLPEVTTINNENSLNNNANSSDPSNHDNKVFCI